VLLEIIPNDVAFEPLGTGDDGVSIWSTSTAYTEWSGLIPLLVVVGGLCTSVTRERALRGKNPAPALGFHNVLFALWDIFLRVVSIDFAKQRRVWHKRNVDMRPL
jgi:hypothetical protein